MAVLIKNKNFKNQPTQPAQKAPFLLMGVASREAFENEGAKAVLYEAEKGKLQRFWIPIDKLGDDFRITFLDGDLGFDGWIVCPAWYEHTVYWNGKWRNFIAPNTEIDPIKEMTGKNPRLVAGLSIIDHTEYEVNGGIYTNQKRMFVCTRQTLKLLNKIAAKRGGLTGCTFDVSRTQNRSPSVGDLFEFVKKSKLEELAKEFTPVVTTPVNFSSELTYRTRDELVALLSYWGAQ